MIVRDFVGWGKQNPSLLAEHSQPIFLKQRIRLKSEMTDMFNPNIQATEAHDVP